MFTRNSLSKRVTDWVLANAETRDLTIGYFGASTGAAAALVAASERADVTGAIVSRGGRPDLAPVEKLSRVQAPTLSIAGGIDKPVIDLNNKALHLLTNVQKKKVVVISSANHLFEEPGALEDLGTDSRCDIWRSSFHSIRDGTSC